MKIQIGSNKPRQEATGNICKDRKLGRASVMRIGGSRHGSVLGWSMV